MVLELYYVGGRKRHWRQLVVPSHLRVKVMTGYHGSVSGSHFGIQRTMEALIRQFYWPNVHADVVKFCRSCPSCVSSGKGSKPVVPPLHPLPVPQGPFQVWSLDVLQLPLTSAGNRYCVVLVDQLTKWPEVFPVPDQTSRTIADILVRELVPRFGVPATLVSDRGTNLLSNLMTDLYRTLGIAKSSTTPDHAMANGKVERFNRTLISQIRALADTEGREWDTFLYGILLAYRNGRHSSTQESPAFLVYGTDLRLPMEAAYLCSDTVQYVDEPTYVQEMQEMLSCARRLARSSLSAAKTVQKRHFDQLHEAAVPDVKLGDRVVVRFRAEETSRDRKIARPWHGPYRVTAVDLPNVSAKPIYASDSSAITVHLDRVRLLPPAFPPGWYYYGGKRHRLATDSERSHSFPCPYNLRSRSQ